MSRMTVTILLLHGYFHTKNTREQPSEAKHFVDGQFWKIRAQMICRALVLSVVLMKTISIALGINTSALIIMKLPGKRNDDSI